MTVSVYTKAQVISDPPARVVKRWLQAGWGDVKRNPGYSLLYGGSLVVLGWICVAALMLNDLGWVLLPLLAGGVLVGPLATIGLYSVASGKTGLRAATGQITLVGVILMVFALIWIRAATVMFAIVYGLRPFSSFADTLLLLITTSSGWALLIAGSIVGGLFAALGFAVSAFSLPMLIDRQIDGFSAMGLSFNATTHNFKLCLCWGAIITLLTLVGILSGLLGLVVVFPLLGYATWHAYVELFHGDA